MAAYMEGPLSKWTNVMKGWQYRWFVLDDNTGLLSYYTSKDKMKRGARRGCVRLRGAIIGIDDEDDSTFTITVDQKVFHFQARDAEERKQWACALEDTILRHSQRQVDTVSNNTLDEFDRRLAEADAYLQLLLGNIKGVEAKVNALESPSEKQNMEGILITAQEMVETVKKSIVLLQLARTAVTANSLQQRPVYASEHIPSAAASSSAVDASAVSPDVDATSDHEQDSVTDECGDGTELESGNVANVDANDVRRLPSESKKSSAANDTLADPEDVLPHTSADCEPTKDLQPTQVVKIPVIIPKDLVEVPATSYSTSEDEGDEFYDAEDARSIQSSRSKATSEAGKSDSGESPVVVENVEVAKATAPETDTKQNGEVQENGEASAPAAAALAATNQYMREEDADANKEGESVEEHKSVIMHLLSQVKLGMDLTKVVLPTFILERRSLLEMYADFFAHPHLFVAIADETTPEARMIACVRFYLSTFSAGRNSSVAKKPYNPILGETFQCFYDISSSTNPSTEIVTEGPVPWAAGDQLGFVAEQVSHHPPISAFYTEHKDKKIQFNGHIWTKSKFLGLSIGVHNIGQGCIRLVDRDEEYIVNFPNGYGRSILTVPWVELGGDCTITCEKTGYNAFVKFHTKPFYGGKVHRITSEVFEPNAKKPFCTMEGEWNAQIYANFTSGRSECFFDAKRRKKHSKFVRKIELQEPTESRCLWKKVTVSLASNNIDCATESKRALEDKQRQDAKYRLENDIVYKPKLFHEDDCQNWIYNTPLTGR